MFCTFTSVLPATVCVQCPLWLVFFFVVPIFRAFPSCFSGTVFKWFWNGSSRPYCYWYRICFYIPHALYILQSSRLLCWSHFCLQELQRLLTYMFFFRYQGYDARFVVWFSRVDFITYLHDLFILIFVSSSSSSRRRRRLRRRRMSMQKFSFC